MNLEWLQQVRHHLRNARVQEAVSMVEKAQSEAPENPYVMLGRGSIAYYGDDYPEALRISVAALEAARAAGDKLSEATALGSQADALRMLRRHDESLAPATGAVEAARAAGSKLSEANALESQASTLNMLDRYEESLSAATGALEAARAAGDKLTEANALGSQADALRMLGRYDESLAAATGAVEPARTAGDKLSEANALFSQAEALRMVGRYDESLGAANGAVEAARAAWSKLSEANALFSQAEALRMLGRYNESLVAATGVVEAARAAGSKLSEANALFSQAEALRMLGRYDESLAAATGALETARAAGSKLSEAKALRSQADTLRMMGRYEKASASASGALDAARAAGIKSIEAGVLSTQALILSQLGRSEARKEVLAKLGAIDPSLAKRLASVPLRPGWEPLVRRILKDKIKREAELNKVLGQPPESLPLPAGFTGKFLVLRKWASYTTVDLMRVKGAAGGADGGIGGGGYFLWWDGWGLVIDPGLGFGKAFRSADLVPRNISAVVATHHHIDHTGDMLPILTCVFEMNQEAKPAHPVDFAFSPGAFGAFADVVAYVPGVRSVQLLRPNESLSLDCQAGQVTLQAVKAEHRDLTGRDDASIGLRINISDKAGNTICSIGLSGDTRFLKESAEAYKDVHMMVVHMGSIYEYDIGQGKPPWHLGFSGTVALLEEIKKLSRPDWDPLILISEWGEELGPDRTEICKAVGSTVKLNRVYPAELFQSVGLKPNRAEPLCNDQDGKIATHWHTNSGKIEYQCDDHDSYPNKHGR